MTQSIFTEIAIEFSPSALGATEAVLASRAHDLASRLWSNMQPISHRLSSTTLRVKSSGKLHATEANEPVGAAGNPGSGSTEDLSDTADEVRFQIEV
eukprot:5007032-Amphidinium_carterae.1